MSKFKPFLITALFISLSVIINVTHAKDQTVASEENRQVIILTEKERDIILAEMRSFLEAVQTIVVALGKDDLAVIAKTAKKVGLAEQEGMPASLRKKLPKAFKMLGMKTHKAFDQLALDAKDMEDKQQALEQLGSLMKNCVSCHAIFKFDTEK